MNDERRGSLVGRHPSDCSLAGRGSGSGSSDRVGCGHHGLERVAPCSAEFGDVAGRPTLSDGSDKVLAKLGELGFARIPFNGPGWGRGGVNGVGRGLVGEGPQDLSGLVAFRNQGG